MAALYLDDTFYAAADDFQSFADSAPEKAGLLGNILMVRQLKCGSLSFSMADISGVPSGILHESLIYTPPGLISLLNSSPDLAPLARLSEHYGLSFIGNHKLLIAVFFLFINPTPFSTELMASWLTGSGCPSGLAERLASEILITRTEITDATAHFETMCYRLNPVSSSPLLHQEWQSKSDQIAALPGFGASVLSYDLLTYYKYGGNSRPDNLLLDQFPETGFLVQDHDHLVLGLSVTLMEFSALAGHCLPGLNDLIGRDTKFWERSMLGLGSLIQHAGAEAIECILKDVASASVIFSHGSGQYKALPLSGIAPDYFLQKPLNSGLPVYLIVKC